MNRAPRRPWTTFFPASLAGAAALQRALAGQIDERDRFGELHLVGGADISYDRRANRLYAAVAVFDALTLELAEIARFAGAPPGPYVPGLLSFREGPAVAEALSRLSRRPDVLLCDGQGRAHPRRCGLACHLGLALDLPTIGVAKSLLVGAHPPLGRVRGSAAPLVHDGEVVGLALRTRTGVRPMYVSIGHRVSLITAQRLILHWTPRFRSPEPLRRAHLDVNHQRLAGGL